MTLVRIANLENLADLADLIAELRRGGSAEAGGSTAAAAPARASAAAGAAAAKKKDELAGAVRTDAAHPLAGTTSAVDDPPPNEPIDLTDATVERVWQRAVAGLSGLLGDHAALADSVTLASPDRLVATFRAKYTSCKSFCERAPQRATLEGALALAAGRPVAVEFRTIEDEPVEADAPPRPTRARRTAAAAEHPLVRRASELFGGRVVRVEEPEASSD
jgi:hypothetical protein